MADLPPVPGITSSSTLRLTSVEGGMTQGALVLSQDASLPPKTLCLLCAICPCFSPCVAIAMVGSGFRSFRFTKSYNMGSARIGLEVKEDPRYCRCDTARYVTYRPYVTGARVAPPTAEFPGTYLQVNLNDARFLSLGDRRTTADDKLIRNAAEAINQMVAAARKANDIGPVLHDQHAHVLHYGSAWYDAYICNICQAHATGSRYRCLLNTGACTDFDACIPCAKSARRQRTGEEKTGPILHSGHPHLLHYKTAQYNDYVCNVCNAHASGARYRCLQENPDCQYFDLCMTCAPDGKRQTEQDSTVGNGLGLGGVETELDLTIASRSNDRNDESKRSVDSLDDSKARTSTGSNAVSSLDASEVQLTVLGTREENKPVETKGDSNRVD